MPVRKLILVGLAVVGLTACAKGQLTTAGQNDIETGIAAAIASLNVYAATKTPSQSVIATAQTAITAAQTAYAAYSANPTAPLKAAAASALASVTVYLLTAAPGNGTTPAVVPPAAS